MFSTIRTKLKTSLFTHRKTIGVSFASFLLGVLATFFVMKANTPPAEKKPAPGLAWMQNPAVSPSAPQPPTAEEEEQIAREEAEEERRAFSLFFGGKDPFEEARKLHEDMMKSFSQGGLAMRMDRQENERWSREHSIIEREDDYAVYYEIRGVDRAKLRTQVVDGTLTIQGESKRDEGGEDSPFRATLRSTFRRQVTLPANVDSLGMQVLGDKDKVILKFPKKG